MVALTIAFSGSSATVKDSDEAELAPDMTLATLDGEFKLSENRGDIVLLYFSFPG